VALDAVVAAVQIISLPVAALSIYLAHRSAKNAREIELELHLAENFRLRWEASWRRILSEIDSLSASGGSAASETRKGSAEQHLSGEQKEELFNMLNWLDWIGRLMQNRRIPGGMVTFSTLQPQLARIVCSSQVIVEAHTRAKGRTFWSGLLFLVDELNLEPHPGWLRNLDGPARQLSSSTN